MTDRENHSGKVLLLSVMPSVHAGHRDLPWSVSPKQRSVSRHPPPREVPLLPSTLYSGSTVLMHSLSSKGGDLCCSSCRVMHPDKLFSILLHGSYVCPVIYSGVCLYLCGLVDVYFVLFYFVAQIVPALATGTLPGWFLSPSACSMFVGFVLLPGFLLLWNGQAHLHVSWAMFQNQISLSGIQAPEHSGHCYGDAQSLLPNHQQR